jgi:hypothetical protein
MAYEIRGVARSPMCTPTGSPQLTVGAIAGFAAPLNSSPPHRSDNAVRAFVRVTLVAGLVLGSHAMYDFGGYKFLSSDPVFKHTLTSLCRDMVCLHFAECGRITEVWSEVDAASRRQQLTPVPRRRSQLLDR